MPLTPAVGRQRQMDLYEFEASLFYIANSRLASYIGRIGLNRYGPHRLVCLNVWPLESGTIRRCGLVKGSMSLWRWGLRSLICPSHAQWHSLLAALGSRCRTLSISSTVPAWMLPCFLP